MAESLSNSTGGGLFPVSVLSTSTWFSKSIRTKTFEMTPPLPSSNKIESWNGEGSVSLLCSVAEGLALVRLLYTILSRSSSSLNASLSAITTSTDRIAVDAFWADKNAACVHLHADASTLDVHETEAARSGISFGLSWPEVPIEANINMKLSRSIDVSSHRGSHCFVILCNALGSRCARLVSVLQDILTAAAQLSG